MALGSFAKGAVQGYSLADATQQRADEKEYRQKRDRIEDQRWQEKMDATRDAAEFEQKKYLQEQRATQQEELQERFLNGVGAVHSYLRDRGIQDPSQMTDRDRQAVRGFLTAPMRGLQLRPEFFGTEDADLAAEAGDRFVQTGDVTVFNDPRMRRAAGEAALGGYVAQGKSEKARSGKPRKRQEVHDVTPSGQPGMLAVETLVSDGEDEYTAPVTKGRKSDVEGDNSVKLFPADHVIDRFLGFRQIYQGLEGEGLLPYIKSSYMALGGDPEDLDAGAPKFDTKTIEENGEKVTYRTEDGKIVGKPIARSPAWKPDKGPDPTAAMREYEYAREQGYDGSFQEWQQQDGGGRPKGSMTNNQRTRLIRDRAMRQAAQQDGVYLYKDPSTGMLDILPEDPDNPEHVAAVRKAQGIIQSAVDNALAQDERGDIVTPTQPGMGDAGGGFDPLAELDRLNAAPSPGLGDASGAAPSRGGSRQSPYSGLWNGDGSP